MVPCVVLEGPQGRRLVRSGEPYRLLPGESVIGVDRECNGSLKRPQMPRHEIQTLQNELDAEIGNGAGDWIKSLVKPFAILSGKTNCTVCEARRLVTNAYSALKAKHGTMSALATIKELWSLSMTAEPQVVLEQLKKALDD